MSKKKTCLPLSESQMDRMSTQFKTYQIWVSPNFEPKNITGRHDYTCFPNGRGQQWDVCWDGAISKVDWEGVGRETGTKPARNIQRPKKRAWICNEKCWGLRRLPGRGGKSLVCNDEHCCSVACSIREIIDVTVASSHTKMMGDKLKGFTSNVVRLGQLNQFHLKSSTRSWLIKCMLI